MPSGTTDRGAWGASRTEETTAFEVVVPGEDGQDPGPWAAAGATWWLLGSGPAPGFAALERGGLRLLLNAPAADGAGDRRRRCHC